MNSARATLFRLGNISLERAKQGDISPFIFPQFSIYDVYERKGELIFFTEEPLPFLDITETETIIITNFSPLDIIIYWEGLLISSYFILDSSGPKWQNNFEIRGSFVTKKLVPK